MIKFNENHIFGNYIKQLLKEFNLPYYNNGNWANDIPNYNYNQKILNRTRHLKINSNIYDSHTHEYLGEYLRFMRDYNLVDLMSLYNCFSNNLCPQLNIDIKISEDSQINISTDSSTHKIYMIPVKFNKNYTLAIDSASSVEIWAGIYDKYNIANISEYDDPESIMVDLSSLTYTNYNNLSFNRPELITMLNFDELFENTKLKFCVTEKGETITDIDKEKLIKILNKYEENLKLFIKIPVDNNSSITLLEGNYIGFNDYCYDNSFYNINKGTRENSRLYTRQQNKSYLNIEHLEEYPLDFTYITNLQLLRGNTSVSYPFADRLMEYLSGNAITSQETISDNILRVQTVMAYNGIKTSPFNKGIWTRKIRPYLYSKMYNPKLNTYMNNHDILGYVDKETEKNYDYDPDRNDSTNNSISIARVDIYPNMYKDSKDKGGK